MSKGENKEKGCGLFNYLGTMIWGAILVPVYYYWNNYPQLSTKNTLIVVATFILVHLFLSFIFKFIFRNTSSTIFVLYAAWGIFWLGYPVAKLLRAHGCFGFLMAHGWQWSALFICSFVGLVLVYFFARYCGEVIIRLNRTFSTFCFILFILSMIQTGLKVVHGFNSVNFQAQRDPDSAISSTKYPNIYHILLDAHPNAKAMQTIGGDLEPFYKELDSLGFITYPESRSNYPGTLSSVSSMLSMDYLKYEGMSMNGIQKLIAKSKVFGTLGKIYKITIKLDGSPVSYLYPTCFCEKITDNGILFQTFYLLLQYTVLRYPFEAAFAKLFGEGARENIHRTLLSLAEAKKQYGPTGNFFYTHILCPHEPCIFGEHASNLLFNGFLVKADYRYLLDSKTHKAFCDNVYGIDQEVLYTIKKILDQYRDEPIKPIIVLHSDHSILNGGIVLDDPCITKDTQYGNLLATYMPDTWKEDAKDLTFINLYRFIFNHLFGDHYPYLENKQIYNGKEFTK